MSDYLLGSKRLHLAAFILIMLVAAFLRWYRLDNCALCSGDEWLAVGPTFDFLRKLFRNPITAIGFELSAAVPFVDFGRMGSPFLYTRSMVLLWTLPYYALVSLFDFPVSESWYRFPGTIWSLLALLATYYFVYQLTRRRVAALFALALQATLIGHLVQSRFLVADGVFLFWLPLTFGLWLQYLHDEKPRTRHLAYLAAMFYASSTPEAIIGLAATFSLVGLQLWTSGRVAPFKQPLAMLKTLKTVFVARSMLWLAGFYAFQVLVELKLYLHDRENFLNHNNYLGRFFGRGTGESGFYLDRVLDWYLYPHISLPLIIAALCSLLLIRRREHWAALAFGWLWSGFWLTLTLIVSNSSSNFTRIMPYVLALAALGLLALYNLRPRMGAAFGAILSAANIALVFVYPLLCPLPENQNIAQAIGYLVQQHDDEWGGRETIVVYFPSGALYAYIPEDDYIREPSFLGANVFGDCGAEVDPASMEGVNVLFVLPPDYPIWDQINYYLRYAIFEDCEQARFANLADYAAANGFNLVGRISSADGREHGHIWAHSDLGLDLGIISIEEANQLHYKLYSRRSWFQP